MGLLKALFQAMLLAATILLLPVFWLFLKYSLYFPKGLSKTSVRVLAYKAQFSLLGERKDKIAVRFLKAMDDFLPWDSFMYIFQILGFVEEKTSIQLLPHKDGAKGVLALVYLRLDFIDELVKECLQENFSQIIVLAAGFDTISYQRDVVEAAKNTGLKCYELDLGPTQQVKRKVVEIAKVQTGHVAFIKGKLDGKDTWLQLLQEAGVDFSKKDLLVFEGITYYSKLNMIEETFSKAAEAFPKGSKLVFDFPFISRVEEEVLNSLAKINEPWEFKLSSEPTHNSCTNAVTLLCRRCGWKIKRLEFVEEQSKNFGPFAFGCCTAERK